MDTIRALYITHNHPALYVGGCEVYSYELYRAMGRAKGFEAVLLARTTKAVHQQPSGSPFFAIDDDPNQVLWAVDSYDPFLMTTADKEQYTVHLDNFLRSYRPDVVHLQHTVGLGLEVIRQVRANMPEVPILYTLHEFLPICHASGLMLRSPEVAGGARRLCDKASPTRCHECFADIPPERFLLRERQIKAHLRHVDCFLGPSRQLLERYRQWGLPAEKLRYQENGRLLADPAGEAPEGDGDTPPPVNRFGFFGQMCSHKGLEVLLRAMRRLAEAGETDLHLEVNGANLENESGEFQERVRRLMDAPNVTFRGSYEQSELAERMARVGWTVVPSIWWENSPMVIQEAFMHRRPVIASDVGGMAEKVREGVDGLHFRVDDEADLAETLLRAGRSQELWQRLQDGITPVYPMSEAVEAHGELYRSLVAERSRCH